MLNIKDPEAHQLAKKLAERRKTSMTKAVVGALRRDLARAEAEDEAARQARLEHLMNMVREIRETYGPFPSMEEIDADMYDEDGLPK